MSDFDKAFELVVGIEGGYSDDPSDSGGETKYGISKRAYPDLDIKNLSLEDAKAIYKRDYWNIVKGDDLAWPINLYLFDFAVNSGARTAVGILQRSIKVMVDGQVGPVTIDAANRMDQEAQNLFLADRALFMLRLQGFAKYGRGWMKRLFRLASNR